MIGDVILKSKQKRKKTCMGIPEDQTVLRTALHVVSQEGVKNQL